MLEQVDTTMSGDFIKQLTQFLQWIKIWAFFSINEDVKDF